MQEINKGRKKNTERIRDIYKTKEKRRINKKKQNKEKLEQGKKK